MVNSTDIVADFDASAEPPSLDEYRLIDLALIDPDPDQPRKEFRPKAMEELKGSIEARGVTIPIIVRRHPTKDGRFMIIDGERRWTASGMAEKKTIPAVVRAATNNEAILEDQLTANLFRDDNKPYEQAVALQRLMDARRNSGDPDPRETVRLRMGLSASSMSKKLQILNYPDDVVSLLKDGVLREYETLKNLSMLKSEERNVVISFIREEGGAFVSSEFNKNPRKYAKALVSKPQVGAGEGENVSRETQEKTVKQDFEVRWHLQEAELVRLFRKVGFSSLLGVGHEQATEEMMRGELKRFREWIIEE